MVEDLGVKILILVKGLSHLFSGKNNSATLMLLLSATHIQTTTMALNLYSSIFIPENYGLMA